MRFEEIYDRFNRGRWSMAAAARDGTRLREGLIDPDGTASGVWADTAYRCETNEAFLHAAGKVSHIHAKADARKSAVRALVEHLFAALKGPMRLFNRTIGIKHAETAVTFIAMACNMKQWVWLDGGTASA